ncbi:MAG: tannase/feruloyl esterase family alpha/beta hydrolase [Casimicrobiaceae bacterium]
MRLRLSALRIALLSAAIVAPTTAWTGPATPICSDLATNPAWGLAGNPSITGLTAVLTPPAGNNVAYCQVNFTDVTLVGPEFGYLPGQTSKFRIRVGLPLNADDGGTGGMQGAWNGKIQTLGNGGFAGTVTGVTSATNTGYVGTGTDTGHNSSVTNPIPNPNPPPATVEAPPSEGGAAFGLNPDGTTNYGRIMDYGWRGQHHANLWGQRIAKTYYGKKHVKNYYIGCSDGGREGHEMAQRFGQHFDGIVAVSPAVHWDRWAFSGGWGNYVARQELGQNGLDALKFQDVNQRALAACDGIDGIVDGMIQETRKCTYDARQAVCGQPGASADLARCLTTAEAAVVNKIWDGPRNPDGTKMWVGWERGTQGVFGITPATTGAPTLFGEQINRYWVHKDPTFNWRSISEAQFLVEQRNLTKQFSQYIGSDSPDLKTFKGSGGKLIASYGNLDQIIPPNGHYNYMQRLFAKMGGVSKTQDFYRYYVFPNATHCGGAGMTNDVLFNALVNWVENGVAPDYVVAQVNPTRTRKVCMYPNTPVYIGSGSTDDQANFYCQTNAQDDPALLAQEAGLLQGEGPLKGNHDIGNLP